MGAGRAIPRLEGYDRRNAGARAVREACRTILSDWYGPCGPCGLHLDRHPAVRRELDDAAGLIGRAPAADAPELGAIRAERERRDLEVERQLQAAQAGRDREEAELMVRRLSRELDRELEMERREREAERQRLARREGQRRGKGHDRGISRGGGRSM